MYLYFSYVCLYFCLLSDFSLNLSESYDFIFYELSTCIIMSKVKERDEQEALKLDEDFKQILMHVRPHVLNLRSAEEAYLCSIWLDKLNSTISQRNLRNRYLLELFRQLRTGTLRGIFKNRPPNDMLMPLSSSCHMVFFYFHCYIFSNT